MKHRTVMTVGIIGGSIAAYFGMWIFTANLLFAQENKCKTYVSRDTRFNSMIGGMFWPLTLPAYVVLEALPNEC
jgi:hypothetical protein